MRSTLKSATNPKSWLPRLQTPCDQGDPCMPIPNALSFGLQGRVVIVTGAANGIGEACARRFAGEGDHVVLADVNSERGAAVAAELRSDGHSAGFMVCDVSRKADVDALVDHVLQAFGRVDVLVNNAGIFKAADFLDVTEEDFDAVIKAAPSST
eukprot:gene28313-35153_t